MKQFKYFGIRFAISKGKGGTVDRIEILEKTDIYFKDKDGKYVDMFGGVAYIELWKVRRLGNKVKGMVVRRFKVVKGEIEKLGEG